LTLSINNVCKTTQNTWQVKSTSTKNIIYILKKENDTCEHNCFIKCNFCSICVHIYSCTCDDYIQHGTICKHIHLVVRSITGETGQQGAEEKVMSRIVPPTFSETKSGSEHNMKDRILKKINIISSSIIQCSEMQELQMFEKQYLNPCLNFVNIHMKKITNVPVNKALQKQAFYSTKRKRTSKVCLRKPTVYQKTEISQHLLNKVKLKDELGESKHLFQF